MTPILLPKIVFPVIVGAAPTVAEIPALFCVKMLLLIVGAVTALEKEITMILDIPKGLTVLLIVLLVRLTEAFPLAS